MSAHHSPSPCGDTCPALTALFPPALLSCAVQPLASPLQAANRGYRQGRYSRPPTPLAAPRPGGPLPALCPPPPGRPTLTPGGHDGYAGPSPLQGAQALLIVSAGIEAGGEEAQAHVAVLLQELSHGLRTVSAGAPGEKAGDPIAELRVQVPGLDLLQQAGLRVAGELRSLGALSTEEQEGLLSLAVNMGEVGPG